MLESLELLAHRGIDARVGVAEDVDPPGPDRVEIAPAVEVVEPHARGALDRHRRKALMRFHLRARMPYRPAAALHELAVFHSARASSCNADASTSTCSASCAAESAIRSRALPAGTVGGRIAGTQIPRSRSPSASSTAARLSPTING